MKLVKSLLACGLALLVSLPALGESRSSDRWVASWATALVARPVGQRTWWSWSGASRSGGAAARSCRGSRKCTGHTGIALGSSNCGTSRPRSARRRARRIPGAGDDLESDDQAGGSRQCRRRSPSCRVEQRLRHRTRRHRSRARRPARPRLDGEGWIGEAVDVQRQHDGPDPSGRHRRQ